MDNLFEDSEDKNRSKGFTAVYLLLWIEHKQIKQNKNLKLITHEGSDII